MSAKKKLNGPKSLLDSRESSALVVADAKVLEFAGSMVKARLDSVRRCLKNVERKWKREPKHIHQLRVATRRAQTVLQACAKYLPEEQVHWMQRRLKKLRRSANTARNLDVLKERFRKDLLDHKCNRAERHKFVSFLDEQRRTAQVGLASYIDQRSRLRFKQRTQQLVDGAKGNDGEGTRFRELANRQLRCLVDDFFGLIRSGLTDIESAHRLRIAGKRIRYALEMFTFVYPASEWRSTYQAFCELQKQFGEVNDHATAIETLGRFRKSADKGLQNILDQQIKAERRLLKRRFLALQESWADLAWSELAERFERLFASETEASITSA